MKQSSAPSKSDMFSNKSGKADKSMKELEQMLEKKEGELEEQLKLTKEFKVCPLCVKVSELHNMPL